MSTAITWDGNPVPPQQWARDHWTTIAYAFTCAGGPMKIRNLRLANSGYPTRLKESLLLNGHDDLNCLDDAVEAGILEVVSGTRAQPLAIFTPEGLKLGQWLRMMIDTPHNGFNSAKLTWEEAVEKSGFNG